MNLNFAYSTDPNFKPKEESFDSTLQKKQQELRVSIDKKNRKGKPVTLVAGFIGSEEDLKILAKKIKLFCGVGGSVKNKTILIQGVIKEKVHKFLISEGYTKSKLI